jgi:hypothetical protein
VILLALFTILAAGLTTCTFGPLDRKLSLLRLESMAHWAPAGATHSGYFEQGSIPVIASGHPYASVSREFRFNRPEDAEAAVAQALSAADADGWTVTDDIDPMVSRRKHLPFGSQLGWTLGPIQPIPK